MERAELTASQKRRLALQKDMMMEKDENKAKWLEKNGFDSTGSTFVYGLANSYQVKEELKAAGFQFSKELLWHIAETPDEYCDKVVCVVIDEVAEISAWGEGHFRPDAAKIVKDIIEEKFPTEKHESKWFMEEGQKFSNLNATVTYIKGMQTKFGYTQLVKFETPEHNIVQWWTATMLNFNIGDTVTISGTVKKNEEYNGCKATTATRCKVYVA